MKKLAIITSFLIAVMIGIIVGLTVSPAQKDVEMAISSHTDEGTKPKPLDGGEVAVGVNAQRLAAGQPALDYSLRLEAAACAKADDMMAKQYWSHVSPDGIEPWFFIANAGYDFSAAGENLAYGYRDVDGLIRGWMNSPGHKANIISDQYTEQGVCVRQGNYMGAMNYLVVNHFAHPQ